MINVIGLLGAAGAGKTTVSQYLVDKYGAVRYSFAYPLKQIAQNTLGFTDEQLYGTQEQKEAIDPRYGFSPRWFLQKLGTEGIRSVFGEDIWWENCLKRIKEDQPALVVIDDFRFINEVNGFLNAKDRTTMRRATMTHMWRIESPVRGSEADPTHQSEAEWMLAQYTHLIKPEKYGLEHLLDVVDKNANACGLLPTVAVLP